MSELIWTKTAKGHEARGEHMMFFANRQGRSWILYTKGHAHNIGNQPTYLRRSLCALTLGECKARALFIENNKRRVMVNA